MESPVGRVERRHQQRALNRRNGRWQTAFVPGIVLGAVVLALLRPVIVDHPEWFYQGTADVLSLWDGVINLATLALTFLIPAQYFLALSQAFSGGSNAIARERLSRTWELLILTGLDTRHLIMGKWAGTLQTLWREWRRMLIPRLLGVSWLTAAALTQFSGMSLDDEALLVIVVVVVNAALVLPLFGAALASAMGILASLLAKTPTGARNMLTVLQALMFSGLIGVVIVSFPLLDDSDWSVVLFPLIFGAMDGGLTFLLSLSSMAFQSPGLPRLIFGVIGYGVVMVGLIRAILMLARWIAYRQNVIAAQPLKSPATISPKTAYWTNNAR